MDMQVEDLFRLLQKGEEVDCECKLAKGEVPKSLWETYSAFANTNGGVILLGIQEKNGRLLIDGIENITKMQSDFWNTINNSQKVNVNLLTDKDTQVIIVENKQVLAISVPRANHNQRPVFLNGNPLNAYRRNYEGDYRCTEEEVNRMLADRNEDRDTSVLKGFDISDLDHDTVKRFRQRLASSKPEHPFLHDDVQEFLYNIGAWGKNRAEGYQGITVAGLLMFGRERSILARFPGYFLDYRENDSNDSDVRWTDRVQSSSGTWSGNVYDFYFQVINKLTSDINIPFQMQGLTRQDDTNVHKALREALVNALVHADYQGTGGIVIEKQKTLIRFSNPGGLRIPLELALRGGHSDPRNVTLMKMFSLIGLGERQGAGLPTIQKAWKEAHWRAPDLKEEIRPEQTVLTLRTISLLPQSSLDDLEGSLGDEFQKLSPDEILILVTAHLESQVTNTRLQALTEKTPSELSKILTSLVNKELLVAQGQGRGMRYVLDENSINKVPNSINNEKSSINNESNSITKEENCMRRNSELQKKLLAISEPARTSKRLSPDKMEKLILELCALTPLSLSEIAELLNRDKAGLRSNHLSRLIRGNKLKYRYPGQVNHPQQTYETVKNGDTV